ncbi:glycosyltransferase family 2 protein [Chitinophaga niabensis]|uniref:glycosyltransferase family 2 protein n=1 Tax=Chitinophaga niabensis TaxID=536979 RepID=UPI0031BAA356
MMTKLAIIIPCYNEAEVLPETSFCIGQLLVQLISRKMISVDSYVLFVDDGSKDRTWSMIEKLHQENAAFRGLKLSRNFGHQNALLAGLSHADDAHVLISVDADLQDDLSAIEKMLLAYERGFEVVYGVREDRSTDSWFKRATALGFYKLLSMMGTESVYNHADYRLLSQKAFAAFRDFKEVNLYLRGMIPMIGFKQTAVYYKRDIRKAGTSKYPLTKMLSFAWDGLTSLSSRPLRFVTVTGGVVFLLSIGMSIYALISYLSDATIHGWASTVLPMYFLGGIQLFCIGLIGEYVGKIYREVKQRPRFIIEEHLKGDTFEAVEHIASKISTLAG